MVTNRCKLPDYPKLAQIWWQQIGDVNSGAFTPQQAMDRLAEEMDLVMSRMEAADKGSNAYGGCLLYTSPSPRDA